MDDYDRLDQVAEDIYFDLTERQDRNGNTFLRPLDQGVEPDDL